MKLGKRLLVAAATALAVMAGAGAQPAQALDVTASWQNTGGRWWYLWTVRARAEDEAKRFYYYSFNEQNILVDSTIEHQGDSFTYYTFPLSTWAQIDGKWYHFDNDGWMQTGWISQWSSSANKTLWYYLEPSGAMAANKWVKSGGKWYYLAGDGHMLENAWAGDYFLGYDGAMADDAWVDGYYVDASGKWRRDVKGYRSGTYVVGRDIPAGEYKLVADNGGTSNERSYWQEGSYKIAASESDSKIVHSGDYIERGSWLLDHRYPFTVWEPTKFETGQVVQTIRMTLVPLSEYKKAVTQKTHLLEGDLYRVGLEIPEGTYRLTETNSESSLSSSYTRLWNTFVENQTAPGHPEPYTGLDATSDSVSFLTTTTVTVKDGDYLKLFGCTGDLIS